MKGMWDANGNKGSGDYVINMPSGYEIDTDRIVVSTTSSGGSVNGYLQIDNDGTAGGGIGADQFPIQAINATQFKMLTSAVFLNETFLSSNVSLWWDLTVPIKKKEETKVTLVDQKSDKVYIDTAGNPGDRITLKLKKG
jgi:hypothetical protein